MSGTHPRGDVTVTIGEKEYVLKPIISAVLAVEAVTGKSLGLLLGDIQSYSITTISTVLYQALVANGFKELSYNDLATEVMAALYAPGFPLKLAASEYLEAFKPKKQGGSGKKPETEETTATG